MTPPQEIIIYDTEYWTDEGAPSRSWNGLYDKPPLLIQIGAFKVLIDGDLPIIDEYVAYVTPRDSQGLYVPITPFFTKLTKITEQVLEERGLPLSKVMANFKLFAGDRAMYAYGQDMLRTIVPSCFVQHVNCPFRPDQSKDIRHVLKKAGMTDQELEGNTSGTLAHYLGNSLDSSHYEHDARNDAMSLIVGIRTLHTQKRLNLSWF